MRLVFLGTGTSTGVPQLRCRCATCSSADPRDKRLRASALIECDNGVNLLIDCGPDFRSQMLRTHGDPDIEALLITHQHYDHVGGIDDLRPYCSRDSDFNIFCQADVERDLRQRIPYAFAENRYPGVPHFEFHQISPGCSFCIGGIDIMPLQVNHYRLEIVGFRIGRLVYITDAKHISPETMAMIKGCDTLVINALRPATHISHLSLAEALAIIEETGPRVAYLTHISHDMPPQAETEKLLPPNVHMAFDGLEIEIPA
ncbi:MAG: MBL fold metallo-hydrolase [Muribaculaceae bacterium]|nr:MBL fold metallo-hydrolase [Muribaculaceae bacterium]